MKDTKALKMWLESSRKLEKDIQNRSNEIQALINMVELLPDNKRLACYIYSNKNAYFNFNDLDSFRWFIEIRDKGLEVWKRENKTDHSYFLKKANDILDTGVTFEQAIKVIEIYKKGDTW